MENISELFSQTGFMPHGHCYLWKPLLVSIHVISDSFIGIAYISISIILYLLIKKIKLPFNNVVLCFGLFIAACGFTHLMEIWNLWNADYWAGGFIKIVTASASVGTGIYLFKLRHSLVQVAEAAKLAEQRRLDLEALTEKLEDRVEERTIKLQNSEELLRESEVQFRTLANSITPLVWMANSKGHVYWYNQRWFELTGFQPKEIEGWGWQQIVHPNDIPEINSRWESSLTRGESLKIELQIRNIKGEYRWFLVQAEPLKNSKGEVTKWFGTNTDINEQKLLSQNLRLSLQERDEFISIASHEMKTPLTSIKLQTDIANMAFQKNNEVEPPKLHKLFEVTYRQIDRMTRLVDDMLDASRVSVGKLSLNPANVNLNELIKNVIDRFFSQLAISRNTISFHADAEVIGYWDSFRLEQVMSNLISNCIKYAAGTKIEISLSKLDHRAQIVIKDYGMGIPKEMQQKIFNRFERAVSADNISGLGLGLYITREILYKHGGTIRVESDSGKGATFIIELPIETVHVV